LVSRINEKTTAGEIEDDIDNHVTERNTPQKNSRDRIFFLGRARTAQAGYSIAKRRSLDPSDPAGSSFSEKYAFRAQSNKATFTVLI
jgi:hypothetical protein